MHNISLGLEVLLDGPHPTLWDHRIRRETLRFLRKCGHEIPKKDFPRLVREILKGPPREQYRDDLTENDWVDRRDHQIRLLLYKLIESGATLPKRAQHVFDRIQRSSPWSPRGDQSEEFPLFVSSGWGDRDDPGVIEDFANMSVDIFIQWARAQEGNPWDCGGGWHLFVDSATSSAYELLKSAADQNVWPVPPWYSALHQMMLTGNPSKKIQRNVAILLADMPLDILSQIDLEAARWLEKFRSNLGKRARQSLWRRVWNASCMGEIPEGDLDFNMTLNHSGGVLGNIIYDELAEYIPEVSAGKHPGLPQQLRKDFERIAEENNPSAKLARVRLSPMLYVLFRIDPDWTARALYSRMDVDAAATFDPYIWEGYLWSPQWTDDLLEAFKGLFLKVLGNLERVPRHARGNGPQLFINMAIPPDRGISTDEAKGVLYKMNPSELSDAASALKNRLQSAGNKAPAFWRETIGPWFNEAWPKRSGDKSKELSESLVWMATEAGDAFPHVIDAIISHILPEEYGMSLLHLETAEEKNQLVVRFPEATLKLLNRIIDNQTRTHSDDLKVLLETIAGSDAKLRRTEIFKRLVLRAE